MAWHRCTGGSGGNRLYTNINYYSQEQHITDVSGFTKIANAEVPYGNHGQKVISILGNTDEPSFTATMCRGWSSGANYDSENQIGAYGGYVFGSEINISRAKLWLGRYERQNKTLFATVQYLDSSETWNDITTLELSPQTPYPLNIFTVVVARPCYGIRFIHKIGPNKSAENNICFFGLSLYRGSGSIIRAYKPDSDGLLVPPVGYDGFGAIVI